MFKIFTLDWSFLALIFLCKNQINFLIDCDHKHSNVFLSGDVEAGSKRGGLAGEFLVYNFY